MEELFKAVKLLQKEKLELTEGLLARLEELKKAKDVSLCEAINEKTTKINLLQSQLDQERKEKLKLHGRVRELKVISRNHEHMAEDLRVEVVDLNDCNQRYWQEL